MNRFVKQREGASTAPNGSPKADRRTIAANAKMPMSRRPPTAQLQHPQPHQSNVTSRGFGNAENTPVVVQAGTRQRPSGQGLKHDPYDTDLESIDTTVNQSVFQIEDSQQHLQPHHQQNGHAVDDLGEVSDEGSIGSSVDDEEPPTDDFALTQQEVNNLVEEGLQHLSRAEAIALVASRRQQALRTIDGDSYPTTTEGDDYEWDRDQVKQESSDEVMEVQPSSPSPQRPAVNSHQSSTLQTSRPRTYDDGRTHNVRDQPSIMQQSAALRNQQRTRSYPNHQTRRDAEVVEAPLPTSQPPTYSQAQKVAGATGLHSTHSRPRGYGQVSNDGPRPHVEVTHPVEAVAPTRAQVIPIIERPIPVPAPVEASVATPEVDYDHEALFAMTYTHLRNESFNVNPRVGDPKIIPSDMAEKPLEERLEFVQKNLEPSRQTDFFGSLSTNEWEDAGDWFLDKFSSIICRTKDARQKKRKLAQGFEEEVEKRYKHVSKKQHQVEEAMSKMKAQGEGLVPKSAFRGKSPKRNKSR